LDTDAVGNGALHRSRDADGWWVCVGGRRLTWIVLEARKKGWRLGLSIVVDLAVLYGGNLSPGIAPIGGLRAELALPGDLTVLNHVREVAITKRLLNARASKVTGGGI
jgi:hypothetical protein